MHTKSMKEAKEEHNIEINEIEQKLQKERIETAQIKSNQMKEKREQMAQIKELQNQMRQMEKQALAGGPKKNNVPLKKVVMPTYNDIGVQTEETKKTKKKTSPSKKLTQIASQGKLPTDHKKDL